MKDTQGIVSSEAVCHCRHDSYFPDSRDSVWKLQSRPTFKKPSRNNWIPGIPTMSNRGELCRGTGHEPHIWSKTLKHAGAFAARADAPAATDPEGDTAGSILKKSPPPVGADPCMVCREDGASLEGGDIGALSQ